MFKTLAFSSALIAAAQAGNSYGYGGYGASFNSGIGGLNDFDGLDRSIGQGLGNYGFGNKASKSYGGDINKFQTEAYGVDNQHYGQQGYGGYGGYGKHDDGYGYSNDSWDEATSHNSYRQGGHQGEGHNQWTDNAWNQWGTNNHWDTQKSVDNKWGNQSGRINVNLNSVSGHYDKDYGQQQRGLGYEGHQNVSGKIGFTIGLGGHSFGYEEGNHSFGYDNDQDYGYGGWANNLGSWNHGANFDNFGDHLVETGRDQYNDARDTGDVKQSRRAGFGYADIEELDQDDQRQGQFANFRIGQSNKYSGTRNNLDVFAGRGKISSPRGSGYGNAGFGVDIADFKKAPIYNAERVKGHGLENGYAGYGYNGYSGYDLYGSHRSNDRVLSENNDYGYGTKAYNGYDADFSQSHGGYGHDGYDDYGLGGYRGQRERFDSFGDWGYGGYGHDDYGYGHDDDEYGHSDEDDYGHDDEDYGYGHDDEDHGYGHDDDDYGYGHDDDDYSFGHDDEDYGYGHDDDDYSYGHDDDDYGHSNSYSYGGSYGYGNSYDNYSRPLGGSLLGRGRQSSYSSKW